MSDIAYPYSIDQSGRTTSAAVDRHVRDLVEQLLFTSPGERVNRPTFGSGLRQLVFAPNSVELAAALQFAVQGALQQWLGSLIRVEGVDVAIEDATLSVWVQYSNRDGSGSTTAQFSREI